MADLIAAIGVAADATFDGDVAEKESDSSHRLIMLIEQELKNLIVRDKVRAVTLYATLMGHSSEWPRELAAYNMSTALLRQYLDDPDIRQRIIEPWVKLLDEAQGDHVHEAAKRSISQVVFDDWLDEPTARYLNSKLPLDWQRPEWRPDYDPSVPRDHYL